MAIIEPFNYGTSTSNETWCWPVCYSNSSEWRETVSLVRMWGNWILESAADDLMAMAIKASWLCPLRILPISAMRVKNLFLLPMQFRWSKGRWKSKT